jgi:radical SAM-linked protein
MHGEKFRFRFAKTGTLRLLSHHDLMRCFERILRRAELPFKSTAGFHPTPRIVFALALPLGVDALDEVVEIEFTRACESEDVLRSLRAQAPLGLHFVSAVCVPMKTTAIPRRAVYRLAIPESRRESVAARCAELLAQDKVWVSRLKPGPKRLNIRPYLRSLTVDAFLTFDLWVTQTGTARADELVKLIDVADLLEDGAVLERTTVELRDEVPAAAGTDNPPDGPADTLPLDQAEIAALVRQDEEQPATPGWSMSPTEAVVE